MPRLKIGAKAGLFISSAVFIAVVIVAFGSYMLGRKAIFTVVKESNIQMTKLGAQQISQALSEDIQYLKAFANSPLWKEPLKVSNAEMGRMSEEERQSFFEKRDKEWLTAAPDHPMLKQYLSSPLATRLKDLTQILPHISEIFVTDKFGALVASSDKTTDYYQADEDWWQKGASEDFRKIVYIEGVTFDVSSNTLGLSIAIPIVDQDQSLMGMARIVIDSKSFCDFFSSFTTNSYCHAFVIDVEGRVISHVDSEKINTPILSTTELKKLIRDRSIITDKSAFHRDAVMLSYAPLSNTMLVVNGLQWGALIEQPLNIITAPIRDFADKMMVLVAIILIIALILNRWLASILTKPMIQLRDDIVGVVSGDFEFRAKVVEEDELDEIANLFNEVIEKSKRIQEAGFRQAHEVEVAYDKLQRMNEEFRVTNIELTVLKNELAQKVDERTKYLLSTQEAVVNMMEDLQTSKDQVEKTNAEVQKAYEELKETQRRLVQSEKMAALGRFSAGIAHEVKNPLGIMLGGMEYLQLKMNKADEDVKVVLTKIKDAVLRADRILQGLLKFARPTKLETEIVYPGALVEELLGLFRYKFPLINIEIVTDFKDPSLKIDVDKNQIQQVFFNLLINAMDAMSKGGRLTIYVNKSRAELPVVGKVKACVISIEDTGIGIPKDDLPRMFEPFFTTKRDTGGTGLGLAVAKSIIDDHNGTMAITSEVGKGTKVTITLPAIEDK